MNGPDDPGAAPQPQTPSASTAKTSTGVKLLIGCAIVAVIGLLTLAAVVAVGGIFLKRGLDSVAGQVDDQVEATAIFRQLEEEYPFQPPADGRVTSEQAEKFFAVTDEAWPEMEDWAADVVRVNEEDGRRSLGDLAAGARGASGLVRSRVVLAEALEANEVSLTEYVWTGQVLRNAPSAYGAYADQIAELETRGSTKPGKGSVLDLAIMWTSSAMGGDGD